MSKKKKKFKKKISQNLSERLAQIEVEEKAKAPVATESPVAAKAATAEAAVEDKYAYVQKDIRKDALIILGLVIILTVTVILNQKTTYLADLSDWIYKLLNLSV